MSFAWSAARLALLILLFVAASAFDVLADTDALALNGRWRFALDRSDAGISERWFEKRVPGYIRLPGSLPAQGIGDDVTTNTPWIGSIVDTSWFTAPEYASYRERGNVKVPFWLQPEKYYKGAAWYQRDIEIPKSWNGTRLMLFLERPHWETRVWLDGKTVGTNDSLATPHEYDLGQVPPGKHSLTIRVDNRMIIDIGENSHSISDHTQGNWNGIAGRIELRAAPPVWIEQLQVYPNVAKRSVSVKGMIGNQSGRAGRGSLELSIPSMKPAAKINLGAAWDNSGGFFEGEIPLDENAEPWNEFNPKLYSLTATLSPEHAASSTLHATFGLREISTQETQLALNGRRIFIRGSLECCIFPKTGHPPTDVAEWKRIIRAAKSYGLNLFRFHSWCPPEAAFVAADELGFYFQIETCWANQSTTLGDGKPVDGWVYRETDRILKTYGNHPSFLLMTYGNEPGGKNTAAYLKKYVNHFKAADARRLWSSGTGWPELPENQFHVTPEPRIQRWGAALNSRINAKPPETTTDYGDYISERKIPVISHEIGQWCVYPNFDEISKYTGYLKPNNFEIFRDRLEKHGMGDLAHGFLIASGKLQTLCYKEEIETALRTPGMAGFELLDLHDFPGQGTALVGVLDPFWNDKGYVTAKEYSRFCNRTVPLARLPKRVFTTDEKLEAQLDLTHSAAGALENARANWQLVSERGQIIGNGKFDVGRVDGRITLGKISVDLANVSAPAKCRLIVTISSTHNPQFENDWDIWIYPPKVDTAIPADITVVRQLDQKGCAALERGGKVLLLIPPKQVRNTEQNPVVMGFSSIFWNTAWSRRQAPTTLGILCQPRHPLFADFPTDSHTNWQWWYLIHHAAPMILDDFPKNLRPTVQVIDDWFTAHRLGLVIEAKVGHGKLLACSIDLEEQNDPVTRQFRASLVRYMSGKQFRPAVTVEIEQIRGLQKP